MPEVDGFHRSILQMKERLNKVSPSFCLAKWTWLTLNLPNGSGHSCHLPSRSPIPLDEIKANPAALHNTSAKKEYRRQMKEGTRPSECSYCWFNEDNAPDSFSERWVHSASAHSAPHFDEVAKLPWDADVFPKVLEVIFRTTCQLACSYCSPEYSSKWAGELKTLGPYPWDGREYDAKIHSDTEDNPYLKAFWKWWPEAVNHLNILRISGGEPLLAPETFRVIDELNQGPPKSFEFFVNSNLCPPQKNWDRFIEGANLLLARNKVPKLQLWGSIDSSGAQAEYIRYGLDYELYKSRARDFLNRVKDDRATMGFTATFNNLSLTGFDELLHFIHDLRQEFGAHRITFYTHLVKGHDHQALEILPRAFAKYLENSVALMEKLGFQTWETDLVRRLLAHFQEPWDAKRRNIAIQKFYLFFSEYDRRRGTNFLKTFPAYKDFYFYCRDFKSQPVTPCKPSVEGIL